MQIEPAEQAFAERYAAGEAQVVWTTLVADLETPVSAFLKVAGGRPMSFLLESVEGGVTRGPISLPVPKRRSLPCAPCWPRAASNYPRGCRPWPPAYSAISATTWCG